MPESPSGSDSEEDIPLRRRSVGSGGSTRHRKLQFSSDEELEEGESLGCSEAVSVGKKKEF